MKKVYQLKWSESYENHETQFPKASVFNGQKSPFRRYCIQNAKDGIQSQVNDINNESVNHFSQFILVKVKTQAQFQDKLRKLRLRQNDGFLIKKRVLQYQLNEIQLYCVTLTKNENENRATLKQNKAFLLQNLGFS